MELVMDTKIVWDKCKLKEIDEAKKRFLEFKRQGYKTTLEDKTTLVERFNPALETIVILTEKITKSVMKILTEKGDERLVWDKERSMEAKQAKEKFNELINKEYKAYSVDKKGKKNRKIIEFDIDAEEILMIPNTVRG